jgi:hypothetical protein
VSRPGNLFAHYRRGCPAHRDRLAASARRTRVGRSNRRADCRRRVRGAGRSARRATDQATVTQVNAQLERLDGITANAQVVTGNVSALTALFTATLGGPLVRVAALSYGVSKAMRRRKRKDKASDRRPRGRRRDGDTR